MREVVILEWESPRGLLRYVFADADAALHLESRIHAQWGHAVNVTITREPVRPMADAVAIPVTR